MKNSEKKFRRIDHLIRFGLLVSFLLILWGCEQESAEGEPLRFATYNVAMYRDSAQQLYHDLSSRQDTQAQNIAAVVQQIRPDVLALMEFDYDSTGKTLQAFQNYYLQQSQAGLDPIEYEHSISFPSNTGMLSGHDLNDDSKVALPDDGFGYGSYEGQYAFSLLSKYPIVADEISSYQHLLWSQVPNHSKPINPDGSAYYGADAWEDFRISSKNHVVVPLDVEGETVHVLLAHPTPPVFDGEEDRNGRRNHDEIRVLADIVSGADYLIDDKGRSGGLEPNAKFVVMGDLNADIVAGDSRSGAIDQLLHHPRVNQQAAVGEFIPESRGAAEQDRSRRPQPEEATSFFGLRIDYVLPSKNLQVVESGVFWPATGEQGYEFIAERKASDHLLVFMDIVP